MARGRVSRGLAVLRETADQTVAAASTAPAWAHLTRRAPVWLWASEGPAAPVCPPLEGHRRTETFLLGPKARGGASAGFVSVRRTNADTRCPGGALALVREASGRLVRLSLTN